MKSIIKKIYEREMFWPSYIGLFINPFYLIRKGLYEAVLANKDDLSGKLLDFGCGNKPYKELFNVDEYIGLDISKSGHNHENEDIDVFYDGKKIPFPDNYFDSVFSTEVFEHIFNIEEVLKEIHRVMKDEGILLITLPFVWDEHEIPYDFARYTSFGIEYILKQRGFEVIKIKKSTTYVETIIQMWNAYIYQVVFPKNKLIRTILTPLFITPITIIGILASKILPNNGCFYHNNVILAKKV